MRATNHRFTITNLDTIPATVWDNHKKPSTKPTIKGAILNLQPNQALIAHPRQSAAVYNAAKETGRKVMCRNRDGKLYVKLAEGHA